MTIEPDDSASREQRLHEILHSFLQAVDAGQAPNQQEFVRQHPEFAAELEAFFDDQEKLDQFAQSMRLETSPAGAGGVSRLSRDIDADQIQAQGADAPRSEPSDAEAPTLAPGESAP